MGLRTPMQAADGRRQRPKLSPGFVGILVFKYAKAVAFLLLGAVVLRIAYLAHHSEPMEIARLLGVDERKLIVQHLSLFLSAFTPREVQALGAASVLIGLVFATEGTCLLPPSGGLRTSRSL